MTRRSLPWGLPVVLLALLAVGCPGDLDSPPLKPPNGADASADGPFSVPKYDVWPNKKDKGANPLPDRWIPDKMQPDKNGYGGGAFGCDSDTDCFGMLCCPTPWGVRLCATVCHYAKK